MNRKRDLRVFFDTLCVLGIGGPLSTAPVEKHRKSLLGIILRPGALWKTDEDDAHIKMHSPWDEMSSRRQLVDKTSVFPLGWFTFFCIFFMAHHQEKKLNVAVVGGGLVSLSIFTLEVLYKSHSHSLFKLNYEKMYKNNCKCHLIFNSLKR